MKSSKCQEYSGEEIDRLIDVRYEERKGAFSCSSCSYFEAEFCQHPEVQAHVEPEGCCIEWDGGSDFEASKCK